MQLVPFFGAGDFHWKPIPIRWSKPILWAVPVVVAFGAVVVLESSQDWRAAQATPQFALSPITLPYVSSEPSAPPANSVKVPDAQPQVEAF